MDKRNLAGYSADTEVLTRAQGWVTFDRLTYFDEIATRSPDGLFEWQHPESITLERYDGQMVWLHGRTTDLLIKPGHPILTLKRRTDERGGQRRALPPAECWVAAHTRIGRRASMVATSRWEPIAPADHIRLAPRPVRSDGKRPMGKPPREFTASADDFAAFMGMYLAEGNLSQLGRGQYNVWIWQKHAGRGFTEYQELLNRLLGREVPHFTKGGWHFSNKGLHEYLRTCGSRAWTKVIRPEVLDLSAQSLERFWEFYCLGDGTIMQAPGRKDLEVVVTTSRDMADRIQEILQKLGGWGLIQSVDRTRYPDSKGERLQYRLVRRAGKVACARSVEYVPYSGMTGSVRVPPGVSIYARRRDRPVWSGGSA